MEFRKFFSSKSNKKKSKSPFREFVETIVISGILAAFIITFVVQSFVVKGQSMEPTLHNGERLFVNKFLYRFSEPKHGDIIVFKPDGAPKDRFIKRVIGIPGDTITIKDKQVKVNGEPIDETKYTDIAILQDFGEFRVPEGHVFVLGDNRYRNASSDSRYPSPVGYVDYKSISGKAFITYWPITNIRLLQNPDYESLE